MTEEHVGSPVSEWLPVWAALWGNGEEVGACADSGNEKRAHEHFLLVNDRDQET